jgi:hypothetical protein
MPAALFRLKVEATRQSFASQKAEATRQASEFSHQPCERVHVI